MLEEEKAALNSWFLAVVSRKRKKTAPATDVVQMDGVPVATSRYSFPSFLFLQTNLSYIIQIVLSVFFQA